MLEVLRRLSAGTPKSSDLLAAIGEIEVARQAATAALSAARENLKNAVLAGDDHAAGKAETKQTEASRQIDRSEIALTDLRRRLGEAEAAEARAALTAERAVVARDAEKVRTMLRVDYRKATEEIVRILHRLSDAEDAVAAVNAKLHAAGRSDETLQGVEGVALPFTPGLFPLSIIDETRLKVFVDPRGYPIPGMPPAWPPVS